MRAWRPTKATLILRRWTAVQRPSWARILASPPGLWACGTAVALAPVMTLLYGVAHTPGHEPSRVAVYHCWLGAWLASALIAPFLALVAAERHVAWAWPKRLDRYRVVTTAVALGLIAGLMRLLFLEADSPAPLFPFGSSFTTDEGVWAYLGTEWASGRDPLGSRETLVGTLSLPVTGLHYLVARAFGVNLWSVRLPMALLGAAQAPLAYLACRRWLGEACAALVGLVLAASFYLIMYQRVGHFDSALALGGAATYAVWCDLKRRSVWRGAFVGILAVATVATKLSGVALLGGIGVAMLVELRGSRPARRFYLSMIIAGTAALAGILLFYRLHPTLAEVARTTLGTHLDEETNPLRVLRRMGRVLRREPLFVHMPVVALCGYAGMARFCVRLVKGSERDPREAFLVAFWLSAFVMLAVHGYIPQRYYLQMTIPLVIAAASFVGALWPRVQSGSRSFWRALFAILLAVDIGFSLVRYADWVLHRRYTQHAAGQEIAKLVGTGARVSGPWSFNLALSGGFAPHGFRIPQLSVAEIAAEGVRYLLRDRRDPALFARRLGAPGFDLVPIASFCFYCVDGSPPNLDLLELRRVREDDAP